MAGTATNLDTTTIIVDRVAQIWAGLTVPAASARMTLGVDPGDANNKTPDATENSNAIHLGFTKAGAKVNIVSSIANHYADEVDTPILSTVEQTSATIEGEFLQVMDLDVLKKITAPFGTYSTGSGFAQFTLGKKILSYTSVALIWPSAMDSTKFSVVHLYNAMNTAGLSFDITRKGMASTPFKFEAYAVPTRASADCLGNYWWTIA